MLSVVDNWIRLDLTGKGNRGRDRARTRARVPNLPNSAISFCFRTILMLVECRENNWVRSAGDGFFRDLFYSLEKTG